MSPPGPSVARDRRLRLVVITDRTMAAPRSLDDLVAEALKAGVPAIQLREKEAPPREVLALARHLRALTRRHGALLFVNDRLDIALAAEADGVHLGPQDLPVGSARGAAPQGFLIGYSSDDPAGARRAQEAGADYIGCGTVFPTATKEDAGAVIGLEGLAAVVKAVSVPVVGIGGIDAARAPGVMTTGAAGVAVVGAVMGASDPAAATRELLRAVEGGDLRSPGTGGADDQYDEV